MTLSRLNLCALGLVSPIPLAICCAEKRARLMLSKCDPTRVTELTQLIFEPNIPEK